VRNREKDRGSRERKKEYLISRRMNNCSLSWVSYCSSASDFRPNGEADVRCFGEFFVIFWVFQQFEESNNNALKYCFVKINFDKHVIESMCCCLGEGCL
jgi:hypothetical protein